MDYSYNYENKTYELCKKEISKEKSPKMSSGVPNISLDDKYKVLGLVKRDKTDRDRHEREETENIGLSRLLFPSKYSNSITHDTHSIMQVCQQPDNLM